MARDAEAHLASIDDPAERVVEGMLFAIDEIRRRPVHAAVFTSDSAGWAATQAVSLAALRRLGEAGIRPLLGPAARRATRRRAGHGRPGRLDAADPDLLRGRARAGRPRREPTSAAS